MPLSRLTILLLLVTLPLWLWVAVLLFQTPSTSSDAPVPNLQAMLTEIHAAVIERARQGRWSDLDGTIYAEDIALLMQWAARERDHELYTRCREVLIDQLLINDIHDPFTRGFVLHTVATGEIALSSSRAMIWFSEALWHGADAFEQPADRDLLVLMLSGYQRHRGEYDGSWLLYSHYQFSPKHPTQPRLFLPKASLTNLAPDFVREVALSLSDLELHELADLSRDAIIAARVESGLLQEYFKDIKSTPPQQTNHETPLHPMGRLEPIVIMAYASLSESPAVARDAFHVINSLNRNLPDYINLETLNHAEVRGTRLETYCYLVRLSVRLKDHQSRDRWLFQVRSYAQSMVYEISETGYCDLYDAAHAMLALQAAGVTLRW